jgi:hypothetical protein
MRIAGGIVWWIKIKEPEMIAPCLSNTIAIHNSKRLGVGCESFYFVSQMQELADIVY